MPWLRFRRLGNGRFDARLNAPFTGGRTRSACRGSPVDRLQWIECDIESEEGVNCLLQGRGAGNHNWSDCGAEDRPEFPASRSPAGCAMQGTASVPPSNYDSGVSVCYRTVWAVLPLFPPFHTNTRNIEGRRDWQSRKEAILPFPTRSCTPSVL